MKSELLKLLRESEEYISGQQLCEHFGVSRTMVWKVINQLKEEGYQVDAVRNKGYRIVDLPDVLTKEEVGSLLADATSWAGQTRKVFDETDSTNLQAKHLGEHAAPHGTLVLADQQSAGRGRRGRTWESPKGENIYMSILLRPTFAPNQASMLTIVMAYSVAKALRKCTGLDVQIKWPNDIVYDGRKLVGILTEMSTEIDCINYVVVGVGINVNNEAFPEELKDRATSLKLACGHSVKRSEIIVEVMKQFEQDYERFVQEGNLSWLREPYNALLVNCGRRVMIHGVGKEYPADALGINEEGELLIRREDGTEEAIFAGEVSVRGVYGYV